MDRGGIAAVRLSSDRLELEPLQVEHAVEMQVVLDDPDLHAYTGGEPLSLDRLTVVYAIQSAGESADHSEYWLNWIVRRRDTGQAVGYVQATVGQSIGGRTAEMAWVIGAPYQRQGYAKEAAYTAMGYLRRLGIATVIAHVHASHASSMAVAEAIGLRPTSTIIDGETLWSVEFAELDETAPGDRPGRSALRAGTARHAHHDLPDRAAGHPRDVTP